MSGITDKETSNCTSAVVEIYVRYQTQTISERHL